MVFSSRWPCNAIIGDYESIYRCPGKTFTITWTQFFSRNSGGKLYGSFCKIVGGVISPLLANIGLHGLEQLINSIKLPKDKWGNRLKLGFIRYADDFIITSRDKENLESALIQIKQWLSKRGLEISEEKTRIVHIKDGFNFLGFNSRQYNGKLLIKPQKEKVLKFCKELGKTISKCASWTQQSHIYYFSDILLYLLPLEGSDQSQA